MSLKNWLHTVASQLQRTQKRRESTRGNLRLGRSGLETLETRVLLSADSMMLRDGTLFIRGDQSANDIHITADASAVHVVADGVKHDYTGVKSLDVSTFDGNDKVDFHQSSDSPVVETSFNLGAGDDVASFSWGATSDRSSSKTESLSLNFAKIRVDAGDGNDALSFAMLKLHKADVTILGGRGNDQVDLNFLKVADHKDSALGLYVDLGAGDNKFSAKLGDESGGSTADNSSSINFARLNIQGGDGNDNLLIALLNVERSSVSVNTGRGNDQVDLSYLKIADHKDSAVDLNVDLGAGDDKFSAQVGDNTGGSKADDSATINFARLNILGGDGDDNLLIGLLNVERSSVNVDSGRGNDVVGLNYIKGERQSAEATISLGTGDDQLNVTAGNAGGSSTPIDSLTLNFAKIKIDGGAGNDVIDLTLLKIHKADVNVLGGDGNDRVGIEYLKVSDSKDSELTLTADLGTGDDHLMGEVGGGGGSSSPSDNLTLNFAKIKIDGGQGNDVIDLAVLKLHKADVNVLGGQGNDSLNLGIAMAVDALDPVNSNATVSGGDGNDRLTLAVFGSEGLKSLMALIDGGAGMDTHLATASVQLRNLEDVVERN